MSPSEDGQSRLTGLCVLVVEDDGYIALEIEAALTDYGARIVGPISTLAAASSLISREQVDVAVLDVALADGWVYPLVDLLDTAGVPVLFVTVFGAVEIPRRYRKIPCIEKPFSTDALVEAVAAQAGRY